MIRNEQVNFNDILPYIHFICVLSIIVCGVCDKQMQAANGGTEGKAGSQFQYLCAKCKNVVVQFAQTIALERRQAKK